MVDSRRRHRLRAAGGRLSGEGGGPAQRTTPGAPWRFSEAPEKLVEVHRRYAATGADVLETHTFALNRVCAAHRRTAASTCRQDAWKRMALDSVRLVREGAAKRRPRRRRGRVRLPHAGLAGRPAGGSARLRRAPMCRSTMENYLKPLAELLANADAEHKPDVILMEIQKEIPEDLEFPDYQIFLDTGIPLWISYRRTVGKIVGVDGESILEDGDRFGRAAAEVRGDGRRRRARQLPARRTGSWRRDLAAPVHLPPARRLPELGPVPALRVGLVELPDPERVRGLTPSNGRRKGCRSSAVAAVPARSRSRR